MNITLSSRTVAKLPTRRVVLQATVGGYELIVQLHGDTTPDPATHYWFTIDSALVKVGPHPGELNALGTARPDLPLRCRTYTNTLAVQAELKVVLSAAQLAAVEESRNAADLQVQLFLMGEGGRLGQQGELTAFDVTPYQETGHLVVPRSEWIGQLSAAKARDILLIEIPMPFVDPSPHLKEVITKLRNAQDRFAEGLFTECVFACRRAMDSLVKAKGRPETWTTDAFKRPDGGYRTLDKGARELMIEAAIYHFAGLAAHDDADGTVQFSREEARLALRTSAALVGRLTG